MLFTIWSGHPHRATQDIDLLGYGTPDLERIGHIFREISVASVDDDGIVFDPKSVRTLRIKEDANYEGVRVQLRGNLGTAVLNVQVDIGFGDAVTPAPVAAEFPSLLELPTPKLQVYPRETVVAEKLEAMVQLGIANSRMKDFFDIRFLARHFEFDGSVLASAITATFARRGAPIPDTDPVAFTRTFADDTQKKVQWTAFLERVGAADRDLTLTQVVSEIGSFVRAPLDAVRSQSPFPKEWSAGQWR